jgi:hypothetical protein
VIAAERADGRFDVTLANAHVVSARCGEMAWASRPIVGERVTIEWPHDTYGGWRLVGA